MDKLKCEFCNNEKVIKDVSKDGFKIELFIDYDNEMYFNMYDCPDDYFDIHLGEMPCIDVHINYCPMCGRKLRC